LLHRALRGQAIIHGPNQTFDHDIADALQYCDNRLPIVRTGPARCHMRVARTLHGENALLFLERRMNGGPFSRKLGAVTGWIALLVAGLLEVAWALGLKHSDGLTRFWPTLATVVAIGFSFALMAIALRSLPFGTAYAVWTGIGAVGSILVGMLLYSESTDPVRILCLTLIVAGMIGLKLNSPV